MRALRPSSGEPLEKTVKEVPITMVSGWLPAMDLVGTAAFALSGALVAMRKRLDLFGLVVLALTTALGGGILRDLILGNTPPEAFRSPLSLAVALAAASAALFLPRGPEGGKGLFLLCDAVGLGAFTVGGARGCLRRGPAAAAPVLFLACLTGVGGGMIRDLLVREIPFVLRQEIYATASLAGGGLFLLLRPLTGEVPAAFLAFGSVVALRLSSLALGLRLPMARRLLRRGFPS